MSDRGCLTDSTRWVVKIGTSSLTNFESGLNHEEIRSWVSQIATLKQEGIDIVLVSSGSIGEGMRRLGWSIRPSQVHKLQAAAAVGQMGLIQSYESVFQEFDILTAQVLLTHADLANRERYLNARSTLRELLQLGVVPIVNENDTVVNDEIRFGDNDTLAALVTNLVEAKTLVLLTDQQGLFDKDPRIDLTASLIQYGEANDDSLLSKAGSAGGMGSGGMQTKVLAARKASKSGAATVIAYGGEDRILLRLRAGELLGTVLYPGSERLVARKQWLAGQLRSNGKLCLDEGAVTVLTKQGKSLLPIGVFDVKGSFSRGEIVTCIDLNGNEIAYGLVNYGAGEASKIKGRSSKEIESILGYGGESELIHRDNIAFK
ncbi:MAG: glutamate 5-kinase [Gammaproteobacteria bacterium]|nr:glutamate 5-kinase [Gammaproteobacteria bacterium]